MFKCIKEYKRNGQLYSAGKEYDIKKAEIEIHEKAMGGKLWDDGGKDEAPETPAAPATPEEKKGEGGDNGSEATGNTPPEATPGADK